MVKLGQLESVFHWLSANLSQFWVNKGIGWSFIRITVLFLLGLALFTMLFEKKFIFFPSKYPNGRWDLLESIDKNGRLVPRIEDCWFKAGDGVKIHGWFARKGQYANDTFTPVLSPCAILWCHGNAGNITDRFEKLQEMLKLPADILIFDYRGYGRSEGSPSEKGLYLDTEAAWNFLLVKGDYQPGQIIIYGNSLGGAPAVELAAKVPAAGLIVQSSFTSISDMAAATIPFIPRFLIRTKMNSLGRIPLVKSPKLFVHSPIDEVVPYGLGRRLFETASPPKEFYDVPNAGHNELYIVGGHSYFAKLKEFLERCTVLR